MLKTTFTNNLKDKSQDRVLRFLLIELYYVNCNNWLLIHIIIVNKTESTLYNIYYAL